MTMKMIPKVRLVMAAACVTACLSACHRPGRLVDLAKVEDERSEEMIRADRFMKQGEDLLDRGKAAEAQREFLAALDQYPLIAQAHENLASIYEAEGNNVSATAEYMAYTELVSSRKYLERMFPYIQGKFSRNPPGPQELSAEQKARAMALLSKALDEHRSSKTVPAMQTLKSVNESYPGTGMVEYIAGWWLLESGDKDEAVDSFVKAADSNAYFALRLLQQLPNPSERLLEKLQHALSTGLDEHPSDALCALCLASIDLRLNRPKDALDVVKKALSWARPTWDLLLVKAAAYKSLGQKVLMAQALSDLKDLNVDPSAGFTTWAKSIFGGLLGGSQMELATGEFADTLTEPSRSYFLWRLFQEAGKNKQAGKAHDSFISFLDEQYAQDQFHVLAGSRPLEHDPGTMKEFRGAVQARLSELMPALWKCDVSRREKRPNPSGKLTLSMELGKEGHLDQVGIVHDSTNDDVLAYCVIRKLLSVNFPKPLLGIERFQHTIMFGPEIDYLMKKAALEK